MPYNLRPTDTSPGVRAREALKNQGVGFLPAYHERARTGNSCTDAPRVKVYRFGVYVAEDSVVLAERPATRAAIAAIDGAFIVEGTEQWVDATRIDAAGRLKPVARNAEAPRTRPVRIHKTLLSHLLQRAMARFLALPHGKDRPPLMR